MSPFRNSGTPAGPPFPDKASAPLLLLPGPAKAADTRLAASRHAAFALDLVIRIYRIVV